MASNTKIRLLPTTEVHYALDTLFQERSNIKELFSVLVRKDGSLMVQAVGSDFLRILGLLELLAADLRDLLMCNGVNSCEGAQQHLSIVDPCTHNNDDTPEVS